MELKLLAAVLSGLGAGVAAFASARAARNSARELRGVPRVTAAVVYVGTAILFLFALLVAAVVSSEAGPYFAPAAFLGGVAVVELLFVINAWRATRTERGRQESLRRLDEQQVLQQLTSRIITERSGTRKRLLELQRFLLRLVSGR